MGQLGVPWRDPWLYHTTVCCMAGKDLTTAVASFVAMDDFLPPDVPMTTRQLQDALDTALIDLNSWTVGIPFSVRYPTPFSSEEDHEDILAFLDIKYSGQKIYFSSKYNHAPISFVKEHIGWKQLLNDLERQGMQASGLNLVGNGGGVQRRVIKCGQGFRRYQGTKQQEQHSPSKLKYRHETIHGDRKNSRGATGKMMPRKSRTKRALDNSCLCPFVFTIKFDEFGFYMLGGYGEARHRNHPKLCKRECSVPTRLICPNEKDILISLGVAKANDGVGRNVHFSRSGYVIPRSQVRYINGFRSPSNDDPDLDNYRHLLPGESSVDKLLKSLRDRGCDHCVLYHHVNRKSLEGNAVEQGNDAGGTLFPVEMETDVVHDDVVLNETFGADHTGQCVGAAATSSSSSSVEILSLPNGEVCEMQTFAQEHRDSLAVQDKQDLMMGCAWTTPAEKRLFMMFSDVLHIDCTSDTNIESRPHLTITGRDSTGSMFVAVRAFLPNERAWVFRWIFQTVMPTLLGKEYISRVNVVITDGDSQETSQLDIAIAQHFPNVCRVRCGWHIVDRGWKRVCPTHKAVPRPNQESFKIVCKQLKAWLYSWMTPQCETEEEYIISKALLCAYLQHPDFLHQFGESVSDRISTFIRENVEPHESFYCFHKRRHIRHFNTYTNSAHEGTNNGLKSSAAPVLPQHSLDRCASILNQNATMKANANSIRSAKVVSSKPLWSKLPTSRKLTHKGEGLVAAQWQLRNCYISERVGEMCWHVARDPTKSTSSPTSGLVPFFSRVRKVSLVDGNILLCSCMHFERLGIPCRHQMHILSSLDADYVGVSHHDVSVTWWNEFARYAFSASTDTTSKTLSTLYKRLLFNDVCGPSLSDAVSQRRFASNIAIENPKLVILTTKETVQNYDVPTINAALRRSRDGNYHGVDDYDDGSSIGHTGATGGPCNTQQETNTYSVGESPLRFPIPEAIDVPVATLQNSPYSLLLPLFKELTTLLHRNCSDDKLNGYRRMFSDSIVKEKMELSGLHENSTRETRPGQMVSSSVRSNKRHRSHGTKHM